MSKLSDMYTSLKKEDSERLYLFNSLNLKIKIIDTANYNTAYNINDFQLSTEFKNLCKKISDIDTDFLSVQEAYSLLEDLKNDVKKLECRFGEGSV